MCSMCVCMYVCVCVCVCVCVVSPSKSGGDLVSADCSLLTHITPAHITLSVL